MADLTFSVLKPIVEDVVRDYPNVSVFDTFSIGGEMHISVEVDGKRSHPTFSPKGVQGMTEIMNSSVEGEVRRQLRRYT